MVAPKYRRKENLELEFERITQQKRVDPNSDRTRKRSACNRHDPGVAYPHRTRRPIRRRIPQSPLWTYNPGRRSAHLLSSHSPCARSAYPTKSEDDRDSNRRSRNNQYIRPRQLCRRDRQRRVLLATSRIYTECKKEGEKRHHRRRLQCAYSGIGTRL